MAGRGALCDFGYDGGLLAVEEMANPEDNDAFRERNALVNCRGDMSRIHIAGVRYEAGLTGDFLRYGLRTRETLNLFSECEGTVGIKRAGNDWKAEDSTSQNNLD